MIPCFYYNSLSPVEQKRSFYRSIVTFILYVLNTLKEMLQ